MYMYNGHIQITTTNDPKGEYMANNVKLRTSAIKLDKVHPELKGFRRKTKTKVIDKDGMEQIDYAKISLYIVDFNVNDPYAMVKFKHDMEFLYYRIHQNMYVQINIESPGGPVTTYSYATSLIKKLKKLGAYIIVNIDVMACSGGYMMACVADQVIANPMAFVGSVGVVSEMPDISQFLKNNGVEFNTYTAGDSKRSITPTSKHTKADIKKFNEKLEEIHDAFIDHIHDYRDVDGKYLKGDSYLAKNVVGDDAFVDALNSSEEIRDLFYVNGSNVMIVTTNIIDKRRRRRSIRNILGKVENILNSVQLKIDNTSSTIKLQ